MKWLIVYFGRVEYIEMEFYRSMIAPALLAVMWCISDVIYLIKEDESYNAQHFAQAVS